MSKVDRRLAEFRAQGRKALVPFITAGDPSLDVTVELVRRFDALGCAVCEIGIPYSDPIADGPVIQASYTRALERRIHVDDIFRRIAEVAPQIQMPVVVMVSFAIIYRIGAETFLERAVAAGISGAIVPDLPVEDADEFGEACRVRDFSLIQLVTPTTPPERAERIARASTGFVYYVSVTGITGERTELPRELVDKVSWLRTRTDVPICIGFGVADPDQVKQVTSIADGAIVGSAIVRRLSTPGGEGAVIAAVEKFVGELLTGTRAS